MQRMLETRNELENDEDGAVFGSLYNTGVHHNHKAQPSLILNLILLHYFMHWRHILTNISYMTCCNED